MKILRNIGAIIVGLSITGMHATTGVDIPLYILGGTLCGGLSLLVSNY